MYSSLSSSEGAFCYESKKHLLPLLHMKGLEKKTPYVWFWCKPKNQPYSLG